MPTCSCSCYSYYTPDTSYSIDSCSGSTCHDRCFSYCSGAGDYSCSSGGSLAGGLAYLGVTTVIALIFVFYIRNRRMHMGLPVDNGTLCAHFCGCWCCSIFYCCFYFCTESAFQNRPTQQVVVISSGAPVQGQPLGGYPAGGAHGYPSGQSYGYPPQPHQGYGGGAAGAFPQEGNKQAAPMPQPVYGQPGAQMVAMPVNPGYGGNAGMYGQQGVVMATVVQPGGAPPQYGAYGAPPTYANVTGEGQNQGAPPQYQATNDEGNTTAAPSLGPNERVQFAAAAPPPQI